MKKLYAVCHKTDSHIELLSQDVLSYTKDNLTINVAGNIFYNNKLNDLDELLCLYGEVGNLITEKISGSYIMMIKDDEAETLSVFHDFLTSGRNLYFTEDAENIYVSTSVKCIYTYCKSPRVLNDDVVNEFIENGIINGNETLIKGLYKLSFNQMLFIENGTYSINNAAYAENTMTDDDGVQLFDDTLTRAVRRCASGNDSLNLALSSDYNSNYILYSLRKDTNSKINAYTVTGSKTEACRNIVSEYDNVNLYEISADDEIFQNYPDIVWRLEGSVNSYDILQQYALSDALSKSGISSIISGDGAEQVFNKNSALPEAKDRKRIKKLSKNPRSTDSYVSDIEYNIKKSSLISYSFDIEPLYPYIDSEVIGVSDAVKSVNRSAKEFHKDSCKEKFSSKVYDIVNAEDQDKTAEVLTAFSRIVNLRDFFDVIENSKWRSKTDKSIFTSIYWHLHLTSVKHKYYKSNKNITVKTLIRNAKFRRYQALLYLLVFEKLFISGQFDSRFEEDGISLRLKDIL